MDRSTHSPHIALVCDWLTTPGGAEKVLLELHKMYPEAPIYTSQYSKKGINWFDDATVKTGWLQIFPKSLRKLLGPLRQIYFSHLDLSSYDVVISVTGAEAKAVRTSRAKLPTTQKPVNRTEVDPTRTNHGKLPRSQKSVNRAEVNAARTDIAEVPSDGTTAKQHPISSLYHTSHQKSIETSPSKAYHLCFCHVPTQYYWQMYDKYVENPGFGLLNPLVRTVFKLLVKPLRKADYRSAQLPDQFITISDYAREQIQRYYHREAVIVAPPVEVAKFIPPSLCSASTSESSSSKFSTENSQKSTNFPQVKTNLSTKLTLNSTSYTQRDGSLSTDSLDLSTRNPQQSPKLSTGYYIIACRQVTWKRVDLAITACLQAKVSLLVVGDGPEHQNLLRLAGQSDLITFIPWLQADELAQYLQGAQAYLFPSLEPFGIAAVEALAAGCPVIAYAEGSSRDFIKNGENGLLFSAQTAASLAQALRDFPKHHFSPQKISQSAQKFDVHEFQHKIQHLVDKALSNPGTDHQPFKTSTNLGTAQQPDETLAGQGASRRLSKDLPDSDTGHPPSKALTDPDASHKPDIPSIKTKTHQSQTKKGTKS